jgi:hypothetical protein
MTQPAGIDDLQGTAIQVIGESYFQLFQVGFASVTTERLIGP